MRNVVAPWHARNWVNWVCRARTTYTLQGWLKGVNSTVTGDGFDVGGDGSPKTRVAADAYGFALHYNGNDYHPIYKFASPFAAINTTVLPGFKNLFNGNIAAMGVNIDKLARPLLYRYSYDQLNRLDSMQAYDGLNVASNLWAPVATADYRENISYDGNGNILSYLRNGTTTGGNPLAMDNMAYHYKTATNQLDHVSDDVTSTNYNSDIDDQSSANYGYDAIGNLVKDNAEGITSIEWTVYGKIAGITKVKAGLTTNISYTYDAAGNRISKTVNGKKTWYVRDASGNVMAIYENGNSEINSGHLSQVEVDLYGSSRLGLWKPNRDVQATGWDVLQLTPAPGTSNGIATGKWIRGETFFELSNHLGNVLATILDRKIGVDGGAGNIDHYTADVASASDYYPFGMQMPERKFSSGAYRYGFNGKENDNEVKGEGNAYDFGARIYDPRLGRFFSVDSRAMEYSWQSPYAYNRNSPIFYIDFEGKGDPPYVKNNVRFVPLHDPVVWVTRRREGQNFTTAALQNGSSLNVRYTINTQQYTVNGIGANWDYANSNYVSPVDVTPIGQTVENSSIVSGRSSPQSFYIAQGAQNCTWSSAQGDVPADSRVGFGGGVPVVINGLPYGEKNVYADGAPAGLPITGDPGASNQKYLKQRSSRPYALQNSNTLGKSVVAFNSKTNDFLLIVQQDGVKGMTMDQIRDYIISKGFDNAISFDGSTSATLVSNNNVTIAPSERKDNSIPTGATFVEPSTSSSSKTIKKKKG